MRSPIVLNRMRRDSRLFRENEQTVMAALNLGLFISVGNRFGNIETVKRNFHLVIIAILIVSAVPIALELMRKRKGAT